ncbi:progonadoliberin-1 [Ambystoma mexicanum]|uniref:progonadoliberin-1 n=1 Tax=Ambystoma mexicanum TaxID=8296 RepID=UPI0037E981F1
MEVWGKHLAGICVFVLSMELCCAQHWSYGLRPGGKRDSENFLDSFQDAGNDVEKPADVQHLECTVPQENSRLSLLRGALAGWLAGESGRKRFLFNEGKMTQQ